MAVLHWDKTKKIMPDDQRAQYVRNMSDADERKWKAKLTGHKSGHPQVEIRKDSTVIVVSLKGGYKYKLYEPNSKHHGYDTKKFNIHIASSGPTRWTWQDYEDFKKAIEEAKAVLVIL